MGGFFAGKCSRTLKPREVARRLLEAMVARILATRCICEHRMIFCMKNILLEEPMPLFSESIPSLSGPERLNVDHQRLRPISSLSNEHGNSVTTREDQGQLGSHTDTPNQS